MSSENITSQGKDTSITNAASLEKGKGKAADPTPDLSMDEDEEESSEEETEEQVGESCNMDDMRLTNTGQISMAMVCLPCNHFMANFNTVDS